MNSRYTTWLKDVDGYMFTYDEWTKAVQHGAVSSDDGTGYVANAFAYDPDSNPFENLPDSGRWVIWFNK